MNIIIKESLDETYSVSGLVELRNQYKAILGTTDCSRGGYTFNNKMYYATQNIKCSKEDTELVDNLFYSWCDDQFEVFKEFVEGVFEDELTNVFKFDNHHGSYFKFQENLGYITNEDISWDDPEEILEYIETESYVGETLKDIIEKEKELLENIKKVVTLYNNMKSTQSETYEEFLKLNGVVTENKTSSNTKSSYMEGNPVSSQLTPSLDSFLQDIAQMTNAISYADIMNHKYTVEDIKVLKKIRRDYINSAEAYSDVDFDEYLETEVGPKVAAVLKSNRLVNESSSQEYIKHLKDGRGHYISVYRDKDGELYAEGDVPSRGYTVKWDNEMAEHCEIDLGFEEITNLNPANINLNEYEHCSHASGRDAHWQLYRKIVDGKGKWVARHDQTGEIREISYDQARGFDPIDDSPIRRLSKALGGVLLPKRESTSFKSKRTSSEVAAEIATLAKKELKLSEYDAQTLEHDINNLRADEWIETFSELNDKSKAKKMFYRYAVEKESEGSSDKGVINEGWHDDWVEPTINTTPVDNMNGLNIYRGTDQYGEETYYLIDEDDDNPDPNYYEWQTETLELAREWASSYDIDDEEDDDELIFESSNLNEGLYGYFNYTRTGPRNKPIYSLVYGNHLIAKYDKNDWSFVLGSRWEQHIGKLIEWLSKYYPGFFVKKDSEDSADYYRFTPTPDEAIKYIKDKKVTILSESLCIRCESRSDHREPIKCLQNDKGDYINVYRDKDTGKIRAEGDIVGSGFNGPWSDKDEEFYKNKGFKEVEEEALKENFHADNKDNVENSSTSSTLTEASYGGAYDIEDDQYFCKEDLSNLAEEIEYVLANNFDTHADVTEYYVTDGVLEVVVCYEDSEYTYKEKIDMRKIRKPSDLMSKYASKVATEISSQIEANKVVSEAVTIPDDEDNAYWYGRYTNVAGEMKKIIVKIPTLDYDEADNEFESYIPEPYYSYKLLGHFLGKDTYMGNQLPKEGYEYITE